MPSKFVNANALLKQTQGLNIHYPTIDNLISNSALIDQYVFEQKKALHNFREDLFVSCMNRMYKPFNIYRNKNNVLFSIPKKELKNNCRGELTSLLHFHGIYPGYPSEQDFKTHSEMFQRGFQAGEVVGIDGIYVHTFLGQTFKIPWTESFYKDLKKEGVQVLFDVEHILCSKIAQPHSKKSKTLFQCSLTVHGMGKDMPFLVDEAVIQESNDYKFSPFRWLSSKNTERLIPFDYTNKKGTCAIIQTKNDAKRIMSCFFT